MEIDDFDRERIRQLRDDCGIVNEESDLEMLAIDRKTLGYQAARLSHALNKFTKALPTAREAMQRLAAAMKAIKEELN